MALYKRLYHKRLEEDAECYQDDGYDQRRPSNGLFASNCLASIVLLQLLGLDCFASTVWSRLFSFICLASTIWSNYLVSTGSPLETFQLDNIDCIYWMV